MDKETIEKMRNEFSHKTMYRDLLMTSEIVLEEEKVFGDNEQHTLEFDIWDGFAYCYDYNGDEYFMTYPTKSLISLLTDMENSIREHLELEKDTKIEVLHILMAYNKLNKVKKIS